jgi:hypothetical protein
MTVETCAPADPESKGGSEATVRIAMSSSLSLSNGKVSVSS